MSEGRLRWYGHAMRRDQEYVGRRMMEMKLSGKRKRERLKRKFLDVVKEDMEEVGVREKDIENRMLWQPLIKEKGQKKKKFVFYLFQFQFELKCTNCLCYCGLQTIV